MIRQANACRFQLVVSAGSIYLAELRAIHAAGKSGSDVRAPNVILINTNDYAR